MSCSTHPVGCGRRARGIVWKYLNWKLLGITEGEIQHTRVLLSSTAHALVLATDLWAGPRWGWRCSRCPWWGWRCPRGGDCWCPRGSPPGSGHPPAAARTARRENLARKYFHQHCTVNIFTIFYLLDTDQEWSCRWWSPPCSRWRWWRSRSPRSRAWTRSRRRGSCCRPARPRCLPGNSLQENTSC